MEPPLHLLTLNVKTVSHQFTMTIPASASVAQLKEEVGVHSLRSLTFHTDNTGSPLGWKEHPRGSFAASGPHHSLDRYSVADSSKTRRCCRA